MRRGILRLKTEICLQPELDLCFLSSLAVLLLWLTYLPTQYSGVFLEKPTGFQVVKKFPTFHGSRRFITAVTSPRHLPLSWASWIPSMPQHPTSRRAILIQGDTKKRELLKTPTKIEEIQEKKIIGRNWTIKTCLLRDSNPNYQCLKITSCRWRPPPRMHSFTATTHFKSSLSFVSPCVCCMLCRMRLLPSTGCNFQTLIIWITFS